jgi:hypothetical protein
MKCGHCSGLFKQRTFASGNSFGSRHWTDGKTKSSMMPTSPPAVACPHCHSTVWLSAAEEVGYIPSSMGFGVPKPEYDKSFDELDYFDELTAQQCLATTHDAGLDEDQILYLRATYWRLMNDVRRGAVTPIDYTEAETKNLESMLLMFTGSNDQSVLMQAEINRELGRFDVAAKLLDREFDDDYCNAAETIYRLTQKRDRYVALISSHESLIDAWLDRRNPVIDEEVEPIDPNGPPQFEIKSTEWWIKVLGMLQHNWALIEEQPNGTATVYFFHDCGNTRSFNPRYKRSELLGRSAIVDSLDFEHTTAAIEALEFHGFKLQKSAGRLGRSERPKGVFYDAREHEDGVYSSSEYWRTRI